MSQQNYIQDIDVPESTDLLPNQLFYFSGFLFYIDGWSWDNIVVDSNIQYEGVKTGLNDIVGSFASNPFKAIRDIKNNSSSIIPSDTSLDAGDSYGFPELYTVAATCRRFQIYNTWRPKYNDIVSPEFFESYSQDIPTKTPLQEGELTWSLWAGDIQSYTNLPGGRLDIGSFIYTKKLSLQRYTPASIQNSSKNLKTGRGFGELNSRYITNYYNPVDAYADELSTLKNGWYGVVSLESTPYTFEAGRGINFDTFIKVESNIITEFHDDYPQNNISAYGQKQKQYIDN
jgi:hypothetical protein